MSEDKPYPALVIGAFVGAAIVLMVWAMAGTNGPSSMDATKKQRQTVGTANPAPTSNEKPIPAAPAPTNDAAADSYRAPEGPHNKSE